MTSSPSTVHALYNAIFLNGCPICSAGVLAAAVTVEDCSLELLAVLHLQLLNGTDAQFLLHVAVHSNGKNLAIEAIKYGGDVQLAVIALDLGNIGMVLSIIVDTISQKIYKPASIYYSTYSLR